MIISQPEGDFWKLADNDAESQHYGKTFGFDFSYIISEEIKYAIKDYVWVNYRTGNLTVRKLSNDIARFRKFNAFMERNEIYSFKQLSNADIDEFISYLRVIRADNSDVPLSTWYQKNSLDVLKAVIHWCQIHRPNEAPKKEIFTGCEYPGMNRKLRIDFIPDEIIDQISAALMDERNPYLKHGITILRTTGIRIGDMMLLKTDCIKPHPISGYTIDWFDHKIRRTRKPMPVNVECVEAVEKLIKLTNAIRLAADKKDKEYLFIYTVPIGEYKGEVTKISVHRLRAWMNGFVKRNNILDYDGELYNLTAHKFRRTLGTDMLSKGVSINVVQDVLGHATPANTKRFYADIKDKERAEMFRNVGIIGNINMLEDKTFDDILEKEWFEANWDKGACMSDGYCTKPYCEGEVCVRILKKQKCYSCKRYVTTPEFIEAHKMHLASLEKQVEEGMFLYGEHYTKHFIQTIEMLKVIIQRLEELKDGGN